MSLPFLVSSQPFDVKHDFVPVSQLVRAPYCFVVRSGLRPKTVTELVDLVRRNPGKLTYASTGVGSAAHLNAELFSQLAGIKLTHVSYKGSPEAALDVAGGRIDMFMIDFSVIAPLVDRGETIAIAVTGASRVDGWQQVPTFVEQGYELTTVGWGGLFMKRGTSAEVIEHLSAECQEFVKTDPGRSFIDQIGLVPSGTTSQEFASIIKHDAEVWEDVIRKAGIKAK